METQDALPVPAEPDEGGRSFAEFRDLGLLWLINTTVFHPRGYALAFGYDGDGGTGNVTGWKLMGDGKTAWQFADSMGPDIDVLFEKVKALMP